MSQYFRWELLDKWRTEVKEGDDSTYKVDHKKREAKHETNIHSVSYLASQFYFLHKKAIPVVARSCWKSPPQGWARKEGLFIDSKESLCGTEIRLLLRRPFLWGQKGAQFRDLPLLLEEADEKYLSHLKLLLHCISCRNLCNPWWGKWSHQPSW